MGSKGRHRTHCIKCNTERILLKNGRYIWPKCARLAHKRLVLYDAQFNTYEEAEIASLNKLIEIVKKK